MGTIRLTTAQALIKFLNQQYVSIDGQETPFVEGIFLISLVMVMYLELVKRLNKIPVI
ncbi:hypothetical protein GCM10020331_085260 [Ectobacillus funiculus]